jgi:hypothetical protein
VLILSKPEETCLRKAKERRMGRDGRSKSKKGGRGGGGRGGGGKLFVANIEELQMREEQIHEHQRKRLRDKPATLSLVD